MSTAIPEVHARIERSLDLPPLTFKKVPHWGWRAEAAGHVFEIESLGRLSNETGVDRYRAFVRRPRVSQPVAQRLFKTSITARAWLEIQYVHAAGDARKAGGAS
jgi:hypothetical protein